MSVTLNEIHAAQLEILCACREVCERHNIPYFLAQGTLLGAVRHKGFIPWDDDIDIIMPTDAMKTFAKHFRAEKSKEYFLEDFRIEEQYPFPWAKIRKNGTTSMPRNCKEVPIHWGICIDIFPLYEVADGALAHFTARTRFKLAKKMLGSFLTPYTGPKTFENRMVESLPIRFRRWVAERCITGLESNRNIGSEIFTVCRNSRFLKREWCFGPEKKLPFEGELFRVPSDPHAFLTEMYGDYMTLPPVEEQRGHDLKMGEIIWDTRKNYTEYR